MAKDLFIDPKIGIVLPGERRKRKRNMTGQPGGGHIAPIVVPPTPNRELANSLKAIADREAEAGVHFKIIETGGLSMRSVLQRSNPLQTAGCDSPECLPCEHGRGEGRNYEGCSVNYEIECQLCPECLHWRIVKEPVHKKSGTHF